MKLLVRSGTVVTSAGQRRADVLCDGETIAALIEPGERVRADEAIDATGLLVFPGFIDPHVHSRDPGQTQKEDFAHSTRAAAAGGTTTILEMPNAVPPVRDAQIFMERAEQHRRVSFVDFGLWGLSIGRSNLGELEGLFAEGAVGVKLFWGYALHRETNQLVYNADDFAAEDVIPPPEDTEVLEVFREIARLGGVLAAHCEARDVLDLAGRELGREVDSYPDLLAARPDAAEAGAVARGIEFARSTGCRFHIVHMSSKRGVQLVRASRAEGTPVTAETCPHYLTLTSEDYERVGPSMKVYPPIRTERDRDALWEAVRDGTITSVGSDHAPHTLDEKQLGLARAPAGTTGVETFGPVMVDRMCAGAISPERLAWVLSEGTARLYGLYPRKGNLQPGADADLTLVDPNARRTVSGPHLHTKQRYSPWEGVTLTGLPVLSLLRGQTIMRDGEPLGQPRGMFIRSELSMPADGQKLP